MALKSFFGTDGIRGIYGQSPLTPKELWSIGYGTALYLREHRTPHPRMIMGKDTRESGDSVVRALCGGFKQGGGSIDYIGVAPTPSISLLTQKHTADMGMMISASHNPSHYNGIKFFNHRGEKLSDQEESALESSIRTVLDVTGPEQESGVCPLLSGYEDFLCKAVTDLKGLKVALDCAHGAFSGLAGSIFRRCGAHVVHEIGVSPHGKNINEGVGAVYPEALAHVVRHTHADLGLSFDGDGDRVMVVDARGGVQDGDQILACLSQHYGAKGVVGTVMSNLGVERFFLSHHIPFFRSQVGDRYIAQQLRSLDLALGGEPCGHVLLTDFLPTGDGLLVGLLVAQIVATQGNPFPLFTPVPFVLRNVAIKNKVALDHPAFIEYVQGVHDRMQGHGRFLVRSSGTEPLLRILVEGECQQFIDKVARDVEQHLAQMYGALELPEHTPLPR